MSGIWLTQPAYLQRGFAGDPQTTFTEPFNVSKSAAPQSLIAATAATNGAGSDTRVGRLGAVLGFVVVVAGGLMVVQSQIDPGWILAEGGRGAAGGRVNMNWNDHIAFAVKGQIDSESGKAGEGSSSTEGRCDARLAWRRHPPSAERSRRRRFRRSRVPLVSPRPEDRLSGASQWSPMLSDTDR